MLKRIFFYSAIFWTGVILFLCLLKSEEIPKINIQNLDKAIHAFLHFVFTSLWFLYFKKKWSSSNINKLLILSFIGSFFFGISIELLQLYFTTTRTADVFDVLANIVGSTLAIFTLILLNKYNGIVNRI